jgi:hypothetical protein
MIHGLDTGFLVAAEVLDHTEHIIARYGSVYVRTLASPLWLHGYFRGRRNAVN